MSEDPQLYLRIIRVDKRFALCGDKEAPERFPQPGPDGDILQIGLDGREPAGLRERLPEGGVYAAVRRVDDLKQTVLIGALKLGSRTVVE